MKKAILISLLSFFAICAIIALIAGGFALFRGEQILNVSGSGDVMVEPDTAYVSLSVDVMRRTAQKAQAADASIMQDVLASIEKLGIAKSDIQTASFNIWPEIRYENNQAPKTVGWRCSNSLTVTVSDLSKTSRVIDAGINAGATNVQGITFDRKDITAYKKQALDKAVKDARAKAEAIVKAAGLRIVGVKSISENGYFAPSPMQNDNSFKIMSVGAETPVSPRSLEIKAAVSVVYQVE